MKPRAEELVLVPSDRHVDEQVARGRRATTLRRLTATLADAGEPELRKTTPEVTRLMVARLTHSALPAAAAIDDAIGRLRRGGARPADLLLTASERQGELIGRTLAGADDWLARRALRDERADGWVAAAAVPRADLDLLEGVSRLRVVGLCAWENAELALLEALHARLRRADGLGVVLELPAPERDPDAGVTRPVDQLEARWARHHDPPAIEFQPPRATQLETRVIAAPHEAAEARAAVREALDALEAGAAIDRIAIVPVELTEAILEPLRGELRAAGLPFSEPRGRPAIAAPEAHAALELLRLARGPTTRDALVDVLRVPDLALERLTDERHVSPSFIEHIQRLPLRVDRTGSELRGALEDERARLLADRPELADSFDLAARALGGVYARFEQLARSDTRAGHRQGWLGLFSELGLLQSRSRTLAHALELEQAGQRASLRACGDNAVAGAAIEIALERVVLGAALLGLGAESVGVHELLEEFELALAGIGQSRGAFRAAGLSIARPHEVAAIDLDLLVICGAASTRLDRAQSSTDALLAAELRRALPANARPSGPSEAASFTRLALSSALSRAHRRVVTWAARDATGPTATSRFVRTLIEAGARQEREPASAIDPGARRTTALPTPSEELTARARTERERMRFFLEPGAEPGAHDGLSGSLAGHVPADREHPLAVTRLERYAGCAFLGFASSVLGATRDEPIGDALGVRERGSLIHDAVAHALSALRGRFRERDLGALEAEALDRAQSYLASRAVSALRGAALRAAEHDVAALIRWSFAESADPEQPLCDDVERAFGGASEWEALKVGPYFLSGRIDRIDASRSRRSLRVIDYKTGSAPSQKKREHQLLQPWLYALEAGQQYGAERVSSGYLLLNRRNPSWKELLDGPPDSPEVMAKLGQALRLIEAWRQGYAVPRPLDPGDCARCDGRDICRRPLSAPSEETDT